MKDKRLAIVGALTVAIIAATFVAINVDRFPKETSDRAMIEKTEPQQSRLSAEEIQARWNGLIDPALSREQRLEIVRRIHSGLEADEFNHLFDLLSQQVPGDQGIWWIVFNEVLNQIIKSVGEKVEVTPRLIALINDPTQSYVVRDYSIQHLAHWLTPTVGSINSETDPALRRQGLETISSAITDPSLIKTTVPGTGLIVLAEITPKLEESEVRPIWKRLEPYLMQILNGEIAASEPLKASLIQAVARTQQEAFLPSIRSFVSKDASPIVRLSSVAALGIYGQAEDAAILKELAKTQGPFQGAAVTALKKSSEPREVR